MKQLNLVGADVQAGIDWLTWTMPTVEYNQPEATEFFTRHLYDAVRPDKPLKEQKPQGFHGMGNEGMFVGERDNWVMVRASGATADLVARELRLSDFKGRCTRIDFQVTADYGQYEATAPDAWRAAINAEERSQERKRRRAKALYEADGGGTGIVIGTRSASRYLRIYHPRTKHGDQYTNGMWRFELELKGAMALGGWEALKRSAEPEGLALGVLKAQLAPMGIKEFWYEGVQAKRVTGVYAEDDAEKTLRWLENTVKPAILALGPRAGFERRAETWCNAVLQELKRG